MLNGRRHSPAESKGCLGGDPPRFYFAPFCGNPKSSWRFLRLRFFILPAAAR
jgi:hypothetical protein